MDNKQQNYTRQSSSKHCLSVDSRKSTDVYNNKPLYRNSRRRENSNAPKNDNQRSGKPSNQNKLRSNVDKRPRARGNVGNGIGTGNGATAITYEDDENLQCILSEDFDATTSSGLTFDDGLHLEYKLNNFNGNKKQQNLNHLLNFHYTKRHEYDNSFSNNFAVFGRSTTNGYNRHIQNKKQHKYNKEQFLQANFQFVIGDKVKPEITTSPDTLIDWNLIEQINIYTTEEPQCPICLYPPIAAKLTRCGHVFCWPCILHYLALSDKKWRKCPICYEAIHINDLKSTTILQQKHFEIDNDITFHLMRRKKGSMLIEKHKSNDLNVKCCSYPEYSSNDNCKVFSKFIIAKHNDILNIIERERKDLIADEGEVGDDNSKCPEFIFIKQALDLLNERREKLISLSSFDNKNDLINENQNQNDEIKTIEIVSNNSDDNNLLTASLSSSIKYYYFYQSADGQNIYLHPLNVKMLQACYGSLEQAPLTIEAKILQKEFHSMDEDHRRKFTCLGHLPLTCQFSVVEVQLNPPIITDEILKLFKNDILERKKERQRRDREEKRREKKIDEINERQMGKLLSRTANINLSSSHEFPVCGFDETSLLSTSPGFSNFVDLTSVAAANVTANPINIGNRNSYSSVANFSNSPKKELWPTLRTVQVSQNYPELSIWSNSGQNQQSDRNLSRQRKVTLSSDRSSECDSLDEKILTPLKTNLGDVLAEAINQKQVNEVSGSAGKGGNAVGGNKKSKKNKKMLVFSTGMNFNGK